MTIMQMFLITCTLAFIPLVFNGIEALNAKKTSAFRVISIICNGAIGITSLILFGLGIK